MGVSSSYSGPGDPSMVFSDPLQSRSWPPADPFWTLSPECNCPLQWSGALAWPGLPSLLRAFQPGTVTRKRGATGTQRRPSLPLTLSYQTHWSPPPPLTSPKKLTLTQCSPRRLRMTAELTAAICFEVSSQVLPLSLWVERRAAQVHNSALVCVCRCSHTWLCEGAFMCTFILVCVGRHQGAEFAFSF